MRAVHIFPVAILAALSIGPRLSSQSMPGVERQARIDAHTEIGAGTGLLVGVLVGRTIGTAVMCHQCDGYGALSQMSGAVVGGVVGAITGAVIGSHVPHDEWEHANTIPGVGVTPGPPSLGVTSGPQSVGVAPGPPSVGVTPVSQSGDITPGLRSRIHVRVPFRY